MKGSAKFHCEILSHALGLIYFIFHHHSPNIVSVFCWYFRKHGKEEKFTIHCLILSLSLKLFRYHFFIPTSELAIRSNLP